MISKIKALWRRHPRALTGFVLALAVTLFFTVRLIGHAIFWMDPSHHDMAPKPWMTIGFVAQSWDLDPALIDQKAGFPTPQKGKGHPLTLQEIADQRGVPVDQIITELQAVILTMKAAEP